MLRRRAFTIPEMLAVVAIVVILIAMLLPALHQARETARRAICLSNQHQIAVGVIRYASESRGVLPVYESWATHFVSSNPSLVTDERAHLLDILGGGVASPDVFYCPSDIRLRVDDPDIGWYSNNPNRYISYGPIGIWQQSTTSITWPKTYTALPVVPPTLDRQGNRPVRRADITHTDLALITDSQISWYAGSWGLSFTYPGDGRWPDDPGYYAYYSFPHRTRANQWAGTNVVYFDASGGWRNFNQILNPNTPYPHGAKWVMHYQRGVYEGPVFW